MMPEVTVLSNPYGEPIATTHWPTLLCAGSPIFTIGRPEASIFSTATSDCLSAPTTFALYSRLSVSFTVTTFAPSITCALVRIYPSALMMKPEPRLVLGWSSGCGWRPPPIPGICP
ncbi:protease Do domain protein [Burkholderia pseudomallei]|nr:protease Do domain protein [Burkholderia pseudomallei]